MFSYLLFSGDYSRAAGLLLSFLIRFFHLQTTGQKAAALCDRRKDGKVYASLPSCYPFEFNRVLQQFNVVRGGSFVPLDNIKPDSGTLFEGFVPIHLNGGKMNEYIISIVLCDKTKSLGRVEPFDCSF